MKVIGILYAICIVLFLILPLFLDIISTHLKRKPKSNRFRRWWSNNVVDLDDIYN